MTRARQKTAVVAVSLGLDAKAAATELHRRGLLRLNVYGDTLTTALHP